MSAFSAMACGFNVGMTLGPAISSAFVGIDFHLLHWHISYVNFIGLFMSAVFVAVAVLVYFFVYDLSKEFDLKAFQGVST